MRIRYIATALLLFTPVVGRAAPVTSLGDLNKVQAGLSTPFYAVNPPKIFFNRTTAELGSELWVTDGTPEGTTLVKDIVPGPDGSFPIGFAPATFGGLPGAYFVAKTPAEGAELWQTDGTEAGTKLVKDINPGPVDGMPETLIPESLIASITGTPGALFAADDGVNGRELWYTDGSAAGTTMVGDLNPGAASSDPEHIVIDGTIAFFSANRAGFGREPWVTNGAIALLLSDIRPGASSSDPSGFAATDTKIVFGADDGTHGSELWQSDVGTTTLVSDLNPGPDESILANFFRLSGTQVIFGQAEAGIDTLSFKIIGTDGTPAGTTVLAQPSCLAGGPFAFFGGTTTQIVNGKAVFPCYDVVTQETEAWVTDGTPAGTGILKDIFPGPGSGNVVGSLVGNNRLILLADDGKHGVEPWVTDGTSDGTYLLKDFNPGEASSSDYSEPIFQIVSPPAPGSTFSLLQMVIKGRTYIYSSDGTLDNTKQLFDDSSPDTEGSDPRGFASFGKSVFFGATHTSKGRELFVSNGKASGTKLFKNLNRGGESSPRDFKKLKKKLYLFAAFDSKHGRELWGTDGTKKGTKLVKDLNPGFESSVEDLRFEVLKGRAIFAADDGVNGLELWVSNGKRKGTKLLKDIFPGPEGSGIFELTRLGSKVLFTADDGVAGAELWASDGTEAGTSILADIEAGASDSSPTDFAVVGNKMFFRAFDSAAGSELWVTDGNPGGTQRVADINPGVGSGFPSGLEPGGAVVFFSADDGVHGSEIWRSDGTAAGTFMITDINPGISGSVPVNFSVLPGDRVLFGASDGVHGYELWEANANLGSAALVKDIEPGAGSGFPNNLTKPAKNGLVYFQATTSAEGSELWRTDGSAAGTFLAADIVPGAESSSPADFLVKGKRLFFSAETKEIGREPYVTKIE